MSDREQTRRLAEAATPGPWTYDGRDIFTVQMTEGGGRLVLPLPETWHESQQVNEADARYIAAVSPDVVLALITELEQAERKIAQLSEWYNAEDRKTRELKARLAKADKLAEALRWIRDPSHVGDYDDYAGEIHRKWATRALAEWDQT